MSRKNWFMAGETDASEYRSPCDGCEDAASKLLAEDDARKAIEVFRRDQWIMRQYGTLVWRIESIMCQKGVLAHRPLHAHRVIRLPRHRITELEHELLACCRVG